MSVPAKMNSSDDKRLCKQNYAVLFYFCIGDEGDPPRLTCDSTQVKLWRIYHRRPMPCCIRAGDTEGGGLDMVIPVVGLMMGMALPRVRVAAGWCSFRDEDCWLWKVGGTNAGEVELRENAGATVLGC